MSYSRYGLFQVEPVILARIEGGVLATYPGGWLRLALGHAEENDRAEDGRSETELIQAVQGGSEEAFEELFRRHWRNAHRAAYLIVRDSQAAEDIAQEAFLAAVRALDRFDGRRPFRPWLHRIVVNRAIDHARARSLRREVVEVAQDVAAPEQNDAVGDELFAALADLGAEQRAAIVLRYLLDYTPGEIARILQVPRGTVNSRLRRGLDRLASSLEAEVQ